jgi:hypothetical protein
MKGQRIRRKTDYIKKELAIALGSSSKIFNMPTGYSGNLVVGYLLNSINIGFNWKS